MARRTNYGFEKRQRELRKQKKNEEKAARRSRDETDSPTPEGEEAASDTPGKSRPADSD